MERRRLWRLARWPVLVVGVVFVAIQLVPYGWRHPNPRVIADAPWPTAESERIARSSCYGCHSNETDWPLYSYVAPMSWLVRSDVEQGRDELNFSDWDDDADEADDAIETILEGSMPPDRYTMIHRGATLTDAEAEELIRALQQIVDD
ncbi:MAG TPA: heme-binding domain-containing protein [Acidimicrobiales bacterium]